MELTHPKPFGRPEKYKAEYCEQILLLAEQGKLPVQWAAKIGVAHNTLKNWCKEHDEFLLAYTQAFSRCNDWWMNLLQQQSMEYPDADKRPRNMQGVLFMLKAAFGMRETSDNDSAPKERAEVTFATRSDA